MTDEFIGQTLADKYKIEELLRETDTGGIFRGTHLLMEKSVAVKILSPELADEDDIVEQFSAEARAISRLSHPNILNVTDFGTDEYGVVYIVTEDAEGKTLKEALADEGAFSVDRAVRIARQTAAALSAAHAGGIIHKNLTTEKILLAEMANGGELVKVLDIGSFNSTESNKSEDHESLERLAYLSPEQCPEEAVSDERSDIYSLGIILFEMLTGEVPFAASDPIELMLKHSQVPPPPFAAFRDDIPEEIEPVVIKALAKNPDMRYQTVSDFAEELAEATKTEGEDDTIVIPKPLEAAENANAKNNTWKTAFIVLAGISLLTFGLIYLTNVKQTTPQTVQTDENGLPVQPLNPATGASEQNLPNIADYPMNSIGNGDFPLVSPDIGGGDGYDPWANGGNPVPGGAPLGQPIGPGGDYITIPPGSSSPFNVDEPLYDKDGRRIILVPKQKESPTPETKTGETPVPKGSTPAKPAQTQTPAKKPEKTPERTPPKLKPAESPAAPSSQNPKPGSGDEQDS